MPSGSCSLPREFWSRSALSPDRESPTFRRASGRLVALLACLIAGAVPTSLHGGSTSAPPEPTAQARSAQDDHLVLLDEGVAAQLIDGRMIELSVAADEGESYDDLAKRLAGSPAHGKALAAANPTLALPHAEAIVSVPWGLVREEYRYIALRQLFPADRPVSDGWIHEPSQARVATFGEGLWQVAEWFTGSGENWQAIATANELTHPESVGEKALLIPRALLLKRFLPPAEVNGPLRYGEDARGRYAEYKLLRGEALYSAVVVRFTGLLDPDDVLEAAARIAERNDITEVRSIAVGRGIRIPLDLLAVSWLPENDPRRVAALIDAQEVADVRIAAKAPSFDGLQILLDPGHGGADVGAVSHGIWESDYVYDIACRIRRALAKEKGVTVHLLVQDRQNGMKVVERRRLTANKKEAVMTTPPHRNEVGEASVDTGVNLRWLLANRLFRDLRNRQNVPEEKVVFLSLHADSLHPSVRGGMVYVPGERFRRGSFQLSARQYGRYREYASGAPVTFTRAQRLRDEAISRRLAGALLDAYREHDLPVHENQPVRDAVVRGRQRAWLPAVLRGNVVPTKVLFETVNINNSDDAKLLADPAGRERIARAIVSGLRGFYSGRTAKADGGMATRR